MTVLAIILTLVIAAVLWYVVSISPLPNPPKDWIGWLIIAAAILYILTHTLGSAGFLNQRVGG